MVIYLKGKHGTRIAYTEGDARKSESEGYVRYSPAEELAAKREAMNATIEKPAKKKASRKKAK